MSEDFHRIRRLPPAAIAMILWGAIGARHGDLPVRRPAPARTRMVERATRVVFVLGGLGLLWAVYSWPDPVETLPALAIGVIVPSILAGLFRLMLRPAA